MVLRNITIAGIISICLLTGCASNAQQQEPAPSENTNHTETNQDVLLETDIEEVAEPIDPSTNEDSQIIDEGVTLEQLIPSGWAILPYFEQVLAKGDLNGDGINDIAVVLEELSSGSDAAPQRSLLLALGVSEEMYDAATIVTGLVYLEDEGGMFGDPFGAVSIEDNIVSLEHYGGSNWRWSNTYRISWKAPSWYVVGYTSTSEHTSIEGYETMDYNLETGVALYERVDEEGNKTEDIVTVEAEQTIIVDEFDRDQFIQKLFDIGLQ